MKESQRRRVVFGLLLSALFGFATAAVAEPQAVRHSYTVGAIASLTGPAAEQGDNWLKGAQLAAEDLRREGIELTIAVEDDATKPAQASAAFSKLVDVQRVQAVIGGTWDFLGEAVYPLAAKSRIPLVTPSNPVEILSPDAQRNPWIFTNGLSLSASETAVRPLIAKVHPKRAALIVPNVPFGISHAEVLKRALLAEGTQIVLEEHFDYAGYHDTLRALAAKAKRLDVDFLLCVTDYAALDIFMSELEKLRFSPVVVPTQHLDEAVRLSKKPARFANAFAIYPQVPPQSFADRFSKRFGFPPKVYSAEGYDALKFLVTALEAGVDFERREPPLRYDGVVGEHVLGPSRLLVTSPAVIMKVDSKGQLVRAEF